MPSRPICSDTDGYPPASSITQRWFLYLIWSKSCKRTYLGISTDPQRRLRQHNQELVGGARSTRIATDWEHQLIIGAFLSKSSACRWERIVKCRAKGLAKRTEYMLLLTSGTCPPGRYYPVPDELAIQYHRKETT